MTITRQTVSISEINSRLSCQVKHDFRYNRRLVPAEEREVLTLGKAVHIGLEGWYLTRNIDHALQAMRDYLERSAYGDDLIPLASGMLKGYVEHWRDQDDFEVLHVELPFRVPLISPSGIASRIFDLVGRVDMVVRKPDGSLWGVEHKTLGTKDAQYFRRLETDFQVRAYVWAVSRFLGVEVRGILYNVLRSKLPVEPEILKNGSISKRSNIDSTAEVFEAALARTGSNPVDYAEILERLRTEGNTFFMRREMEIPPEDLSRWALEMYHITRDLRRSKVVYRNPTACSLHGGCEYRDLCSGLLPADEVSTRYRTLVSKHPELSDVDLESLRPAKAALKGESIDHAFIANLVSTQSNGGDQ